MLCEKCGAALKQDALFCALLLYILARLFVY